MSHEQLLPRRWVRVTTPTSEHEHYRNAVGRIVDVRDFSPRRFCQVTLANDAIWFESTELHTEREEASYSHSGDALGENPIPNNICSPRSPEAPPIFCEISGCEQFATWDCHPAIAPAVTSLQTTIALCEQHAREADPTLGREVRS